MGMPRRSDVRYHNAAKAGARSSVKFREESRHHIIHRQGHDIRTRMFSKKPLRLRRGRLDNLSIRLELIRAPTKGVGPGGTGSFTSVNAASSVLSNC